MDTIDQQLIVHAKKGLPLTSHPFNELAAQLGITPQEAITRLQKLQADRVIRRFGVSLKPSGVGFCANALVAWKVPQSRVAEVAEYFSRHEEISHCYEREIDAEKWPYNMYTVMHAHERESIQALVNKFSSEIMLEDYLVLYSTRNLKTDRLEESKQC